MIQLIKQVIKSFKNSILLLISLAFISFAIIFASMSSLYLSSNISNSYQTLHKNSDAETAIASIDSSNLKNSLDTQTIYDLTIDLSETSQDIKKPNEMGLYFNNLIEYGDVKTSFLYQPAKLSTLVFNVNENANNYIFPYYVASTTPNTENIDNPYFAATGINDPNHMFELRAKGILKSYGDIEIPQGNPSKWRAEGMKFHNKYNPEKIIYDIDPLTGLTSKKRTENGLVTSYGFFNNGIIDDNIVVVVGSTKYPTNVIDYTDQTSSNIDLTKNNRYTFTKNGQTIESPFFVSSTKWDTTIDFDLTQYGNGLEGIKKILSQIANGADPFNIISSISPLSIAHNLPLGDIDWNIANFNPYYDYLKILHDPIYLTDSYTSKFAKYSGTSIEGSNIIKDTNDLILNIHVDETKLSDLQKQTLEYVREVYGDYEYNSLTRFIYTVKTSWIKEELLSQYSDNPTIINEINKLNFDNLNDLTQPIQTESNGEDNIEISGKSTLMNWLSKYATIQQQNFEEKLATYEKEFLSFKLSSINDISFNIQKSFTITDSESSRNYLVSQKNTINNKYLDESVNELSLTSGSKLENSTKYLDVIDKAFAPNFIENGKIPQNSVGWSPNETGNYLINLVKLISDVEIENIDENSKYYTQVKELSNLIYNQYLEYGNININDYYKLFAIANIELKPNGTLPVSTTNQNVTISILARGGLVSGYYYASLIYATPYGSAAVVTDKWLDANNKKIISQDEWKKALNYSSSEFLVWIKNLPDENKFTINSKDFVIIGTGQSPENAYPIISITNPIPNPKIESLIFVNEQAYESILSTNSTLYQDEYFALKFNSNKNKQLSEVNNVLEQYLQKGAYLATDTKNNKNLLTLRYSFPIIINNYVQIFATVLTVLLVAVGIYLCFLMIKIYVDKNQVSLAIIKANGMPTWKIILALSLFGLITAIISGILGYLITYFAQSVFINILSNYWFIPIGMHNFSAVGFLGGGIAIYLCILFFIIIGVIFVFKQPINNLISKNTDIRINKLLYIFKAQKFNLPITIKFTLSLIVNKIGKFILFIVLCSFGLSIIAVGVSTPLKFNSSKINTENNRKYDYSFDLLTPTEQSGLYKYQDYEYLGITNSSIGVGGLYDGASISYSNSFIQQPYQLLLDDPNKRDLLALRNLDGTVKMFGENKNEKRYFTNLLLPSYTANNLVQNDIDFLRNGVFTKWLLDFDINVASLSINAWELVKQSLSSELVATIDTISNQFVEDILSNEQLYEANKIGSGNKNNPKPFLTLQNGIYKLESSNVINEINVSNLKTIRLNDSFLKFIGMVYGDENLSKKDVKISYGIIPKNDSMETYTYIDGVLNNKNISISSLFNSGKNKLIDINEKIMGINSDSKYVTLIDKDGKNITDLITKKDGEYFPVVINNGASLKYNLDVNDTFELTPTNTYDRFSKKLYDDTTNNTYKFKVVGISSDSFSTAFYTSQNFANEILKMRFEDGALIISNFKKYNIDPTSNSSFKNYIISAIGNPSVVASNSYCTLNINSNIPDWYVPFNGIFTDEQDPLFLSNIAIDSKSGIWGNFTNFYDKTFENGTANSGTFPVFDLLIPYDLSRLEKFKEYLQKNGYKNYQWTNDIRYDIISIFINKFPTSDNSFINYLQNIFGNNSTTLSIQDSEFFDAVFSTYSTIFQTLIVIQNLVISILVPIIIMIVMIVSSVMINEFRKMLAILKTLGYSDKVNFKMIMATFIPVLIISLLIGLGILWLMLFVFQTLIFNLASIYLSSTINFLPYIYGAIAIVAILLINFIYVYIYLKKQNLKNSIT